MNRNYTEAEVIALDRERDERIGTTDKRQVKLGAVVEGKKRIPVAGEPDWVYVTIEDRSYTKVKRGAANVTDKYGADVWIGREAGNSYYTILEVVGRGNGTGSGSDSGSGTVPHSSQHAFPLRWRQPLGISQIQDPLFIRSIQVTDLEIQPSSGFRFKVMPGMAKVNSVDLTFPDGLSFDVDDTEVAATPGEAVICRVELDDTGVIVLTYGAAYAEPVTEQGAIDNAPVPTAGCNTLGYIWLPEGMTGGQWHHILPAPLAERTGGARNADASSIPYTPATPGDWTSPPDDVAEALDDLAAGVVGGSGTVNKRATMWHDESLVTAGAALTRDSVDATTSYATRTFNSSPAQNDAFTNSFVLIAGSYTLFILGFTATDRGILEIFLDGVSQGTQDWYAAVGAVNVTKSMSVTVVGTGYHVLRGLIATKHASSSGYQMMLTKFWLVPSAD